MSPENQCPDCEEPLEQMKLNESHGQPSIVSTEDRIVSRLMLGSLTPVPLFVLNADERYYTLRNKVDRLIDCLLHALGYQ